MRKIIMILFVFVSLDSIAQDTQDLIYQGKWIGTFEIGTAVYDIEYNLTKSNEYSDRYEGVAEGRNRLKHDAYHPPKVKLFAKIFHQDANLYFSAFNKMGYNLLSGRNSCELLSPLFYKNTGDTSFEIWGHYSYPKCWDKQGGNVYLKRIFTEQELQTLKDIKHKQDIEYHAKYDNQQVTYIPCEKANFLMSKFKLNYPCKNYIFYIKNGDTSYRYKEPFTYDCCYSSDKAKLCIKSDYSCDNRLIGAWRTEDSKFVYQFKATGNKNAPMKIITYSLDVKDNKYKETDVFDNVMISNDVYATQIGNSYFLEKVDPTVKNKEIVYQRYVSKYLIDEKGNLIFYPVSAQYTSLNKQFTSTEEYREYISKNMKQEGFVLPDLHLIKCDTGTQLPKSSYDKNQQNQLISSAALLFILSAIATPNNICNSCGGTGVYGIESGNSISGMSCAACHGTGKK